ncbi:MAG: SET domain-containing protein [Planctomycetes bacterium]|nr:SET domain-containing protein [Planctomycetota bacterium]
MTPTKRRNPPKGRRLPISCPPGLELRTLPGKGRGVFATRRFRRGALVERSPVIVLPEEEWRRLAKTRLDHYVYEWAGDGGCSMVLGLGSLYNHSYEPSVENFVDRRNLAMEWVALRDIAPGEEITVNYNDADDPLAELWFEAR